MIWLINLKEKKNKDFQQGKYSTTIDYFIRVEIIEKYFIQIVFTL